MPNVEKSEIFCLAAKGEIFGLRPQVKLSAGAFGFVFVAVRTLIAAGMAVYAQKDLRAVRLQAVFAL